MQIKLTSILVADQAHALEFYTTKLGFVKHADIPMGQTYRWLTVTSPDGVEGVELVLEPMGIPAAQDYQQALFDAGIPITAFITTDVQSEYAKLVERGVTFRGPPQSMGPIIAAMFEDTCGNLVHLVQPLV